MPISDTDFKANWFFAALSGPGVGDISGGFWLRHSGTVARQLPWGQACVEGIIYVPGFFRTREIYIKPCDVRVGDDGVIVLYAGKDRVEITLIRGEDGTTRATLGVRTRRGREHLSVFSRLASPPCCCGKDGDTAVEFE